MRARISPLLNAVRLWLIAAFAVLVFAMPAAISAEETADTAPKSAVETESAPEAIKPAPIKNKLIATPEPDLSVTIEGEDLPGIQVVKNEDGHVFVRAEPILDYLNDTYEFNGETGALVVNRSQDGVKMELYTDTGIIKANGKAIGKLRIFGEVTENSITLTPNAIAVLSGARPKYDAEAKILHFELDPRLKVATGFQIYVDGIRINNPEPAPKSVGPVLLLPLIPIANELGGFVTVSPDRTTVTIRRAQDSAEFELNLTTGLIRDAGRPVGISKDATYIDQTNLLLPVSALEALTGTHIAVDPGSDRVDITLDERLTGAIAPGERVDDLAKDEPFTVETLSFTTGIDIRNEATLDFRVKGINGRLRYEIPDFPTSGGELQPSWGSLQYRTLDGLSGSFGDYSADYRELDGVGVRRIRGASATQSSEHGRWALAVGAPVNGSEPVSDDQNRFTFGGLAAGVRWADAEGWEAGLSLRSDDMTEDQRVVLSLISGRLGRQKIGGFTWDARTDFGYFKGPDRTKSFDARANGSARIEFAENWDFDITASYDGSEFLKSVLSREALEERLARFEENQLDSDDTETIPDIRREGKDQAALSASLQYSARRDIGVFKNPGAALTMQRSTSGVSVGSDEAVNLNNWGITASTSIAKTNTYITANYTQYSQDYVAEPEKDEEGYGLTVQSYQNFKYGTVRAQYSETQRGDNDKRQRADVAVSLKAKNFALPKEATVSIGPSVNAVWTPEASFLRGGVVATADSGEMFGKQNNVTASFGVLQSFGGQGGGEADTYFTLNAGRRLRLNDNLSLGLTYRNDLQGEQRFGIRLDGRYRYNEARKFSSTQDGRGVLKGRAFLDKNRDGVRQEDEPGLRAVVLRVTDGRRKLGLRTDGDGYYTIQNIKSGIKTITLDNRSLPLGYALSDETLLRATIRDGHITTVDLPVVQRGQIRGFAYVDDNGNGEFEKGETRLEGARLKLVSSADEDDIRETVTTSFGQYAFDDLPAGEYSISLVKTNNSGAIPGEGVTLTLDPSSELMSRARIAARPAGKETEFASVDDVPPDDPPPDIGSDEGEGVLIGSP